LGFNFLILKKLPKYIESLILHSLKSDEILNYVHSKKFAFCKLFCCITLNEVYILDIKNNFVIIILYDGFKKLCFTFFALKDNVP